MTDPREPRLTPEEAERAIYIDFEGFLTEEPSFIGVSIDSEFYQIVFDPALQLAAEAKHKRVGSGKLLTRELLERAVKEDRRIVAFTQCEKQICKRFYQIDLSPVYVDARSILKKWVDKTHPGLDPRPKSLKEYLRLIGYKRPTCLGEKQAARRIRAVRDMGLKKGSYEALTSVVKAKWTKVLEYNRIDVEGMRELCMKAVRGSSPKGEEAGESRPQIKWIRLQDICLALVDRKKIVHIHASTDVPANLRAAVSQEGGRVDILMNMLYNKNCEDVIDSLAHEMSHIVLGQAGHGRHFDRKWAELRKRIMGEYRDLDRLSKARRLAEVHLAGCTDMAGKPKFGHAERVAGKLPLIVEKSVAYLHDLLEDSPTYNEDQLRRDFPARIAETVVMLTRQDKNEDYMTYIRRLSLEPLARRVKLADLCDNLDPDRPIADKALAKALRVKYHKALEHLLAFRDV
ncbi:MAG: hypothetical protein ACXW2V_06825 [Candidatus Aminicenantales bacterium]